MIEELDFPGYFLVVHDIVTFCQEQRHLLPGPGLGGELGGLLRARHHQRRRRALGPAVRAVPRPGARRPARHRHRHRVRPAGRGDPARLPEVRPPPHRPGRERHLLPAALGDPRHGEGVRLLARPAGRVEQGHRPLGRPEAGGGHSRARRALRERAADLPPAPRHPLRRHGDLRPAGHRGLPGRVGPDGEPHRAAVGQGRLRRDRARQVRPARARHAVGAALRVRHDRVRARHQHAATSTTPRSTTCCAGPTRSACSRSRAGPRWRRCRGSSRPSSTTSSSRSR